MASGIHKDSGTVSCEESIEYTKKWCKEHNYELTNVPAKQIIDEALADPKIPPGFKKGILLYLREYRSILYVLGRQGVEDAGQWKVTWTDEDGSNNVEFFDAEETAIKFINDKSEIDDTDAVWSVFTRQTRFDAEFQKELTFTKFLTLQQVKDYPKRYTFSVTNKFNNYTVECTRDEVAEHVQKAIDATKLLTASKFTLMKRVKPVGDEVWGNWWKRVRVNSI